MIRDLELIQNLDILYQSKIILYGASAMGKKIKKTLDYMNIKAEGFCDSDENKWGTSFEGLKIYSIEEMKKRESIIIIISSQYLDEITHTLSLNGLDEIHTYTWFAFHYALIFNRDSQFLPSEFGKLIGCGYRLWLEHQKNIVYTWNSKTIALDILEKSPIVVLHPGKVGSSSVYKSLCDMGIYALHETDMYFDRLLCPSRKADKEYLVQFLKQNRRVKLISLVREPIARDLSYFFQSVLDDPEWHVRGMLSNDWVKDCEKILEWYTYEKSYFEQEGSLVDWKDYLAAYGKHGTMFDWFDYELKNVWGIDVYATPFDREKGYTIIEQGNVSVLIMRLENLNEMEPVIGDYIGRKDFKLINDNMAKDKPYHFAYQELKNKIRLKQGYVDYYYNNNEYMDHFYSRDQQAAFLRKWSKNIISEQVMGK